MSKKVLVVDDEPQFLEVISLRLKSSGYDVDVALNGKEGLNLVKKNKPDVVLLDILMPELDGLQALKKIKRMNKNLPVFMITAFSNEERFEEAKKLGASGFIVKTSDLKKELDNVFSAIRIAEKYKATKKGKT
ncbi:MAG: response regulator [Candidatus Omnitrophica bacterium]|nr:response regulator [Candidatus Omnitrophota bacterium]